MPSRDIRRQSQAPHSTAGQLRIYTIDNWWLIIKTKTAAIMAAISVFSPLLWGQTLSMFACDKGVERSEILEEATASYKTPFFILQNTIPHLTPYDTWRCKQPYLTRWANILEVVGYDLWSCDLVDVKFAAFLCDERCLSFAGALHFFMTGAV